MPLLLKDISLTLNYSPDGLHVSSGFADALFSKAVAGVLPMSLPWSMTQQYIDGCGIPAQQVAIAGSFFDLVYQVSGLSIVQTELPISEGELIGSIHEITWHDSMGNISFNSSIPRDIGRRYNVVVDIYNYATGIYDTLSVEGAVRQYYPGNWAIQFPMPPDSMPYWGGNIYAVSVPVSGLPQYHYPKTPLDRSVPNMLYANQDILETDYDEGGAAVQVVFSLSPILPEPSIGVVYYYPFDRNGGQIERFISNVEFFEEGPISYVYLPWHRDSQYPPNEDNTAYAVIIYKDLFEYRVESSNSFDPQPFTPTWGP
jgi:hypothetical protein